MQYNIKESLSFAKQARLCPPPGLEKIPGQDIFIKKHMAVCPYCGTDISIYGANDEPWEKLAQQLASMKKKDNFSGLVKKGELRWISPGLAGWREGFYYTPPMVFVAEIDSDFPEIVQVVQVYDDVLLAGPGDLILTEEDTGIGNLIIECWNSYTLKTDFLDKTVTSLSSRIIKTVDKMISDSNYEPSWAFLPPPMMENDPRIYFRRLEVDVAYTFSSRAASELTTFVSGGMEDATSHVGPIDLMERIKKIRPGISWKHEVKTPDEIILAAEFPPSELRMAAEDEQTNTGVAKCALFHNGVLIDFAPVYFNDLEISRSESKIEVSGMFKSDMVLKDAVILGGWYIYETKQLKIATQADINTDDGFFYFKFNLPGNTKGELRVAIESDI